MLPRVNLLRGYLKACARHRLCSSRTFGTTNALFQEELAASGSGESKAPKKAANKTKKKFSELPKHFVNPDGSVSAPLPEWTGGLETPSCISVLYLINICIICAH